MQLLGPAASTSLVFSLKDSPQSIFIRGKTFFFISRRQTLWE